jgi:hypothetical protein
MCFSDLSSLVGSSTDWSNFQTETFQGRNRESGIGNRESGSSLAGVPHLGRWETGIRVGRWVLYLGTFVMHATSKRLCSALTAPSNNEN